jgi:hypothetical protein
LKGHGFIRASNHPKQKTQVRASARSNPREK